MTGVQTCALPIFFCLGLVVAFVVLVTLLTFLQQGLEKRKEARKATELRKRVGW